MRVLVLAYFFPPLGGGGCQRTVKLVRYLEPLGWTASVITTSARDYWIHDPTLLDELPASAEILRVGGFTAIRALRMLERAGFGFEETQGSRRRGVFRALRALQRWFLLPDGYGGWARAARDAANRRIRSGGIDAIWTTSSPESAHLAGLSLKRRFGIPWVADFRDPWVGRATYRPPTRWHDRRHRAMEGEVVRSADRITVVSEPIAALYRARYPELDPARFVLLPNGFDPDDWRRAGEGGVSTQDVGRFVLLHAGQLAHRPTVRTLLHAARRVLEDDPPARRELRIRFMGGNEELGAAERGAMERGLALADVVEIVPARPHIAALRSMRAASALVLLGHGGPADSLLYTGKIYEYLTSGRPVLGIADEGPAASLIRETRAGPVLGSGDVDGVARSLKEWLRAWRGGADLTIRVPDAVSAPWERRLASARAASILTEIASNRPR